MSNEPKKSRYLFFDLLRGWSLIIMFEAHVFNAFLQPALKNEWWFQLLNYINGLVAPAFLFVSGAVFYLSTFGKTDELRKFGPSFRKKLYRIILIFLAGYSLHLPFLSLKRMMNDADAQTLSHFYSVDILQCIAAGLLLILLLKLIIKNEKAFLYTSGIIFLLLAVFSPLVWNSDPVNYFPLYIADYFTPKYGSLFPLFPWLAFLLAGVVFAYFYITAKAKGNESLFIKYMFITGTVSALLGFLLLSELFVPESIRLIRPNPIFLLQRLGFVLIMLSLSWYFFRIRKEKKSFITEVGKESLLVYWLHLQLIFRRFYDEQSVDSIVNKSFNGIESAAAWLLLTILMILAAVYWSRLKSAYPKFAVYAVRGIVWGCIIIFFLN